MAGVSKKTIVFTLLIYMVTAADAKVKGNFQCTHSPTSCSTTNLPTVKDGYFHCHGNPEVSKGDVCTLTCNSGTFPAFQGEVVCEARTSNQGENWSDGIFICLDCKEWNEWSESEYKVIYTRQNWSESRQLCGKFTADLVVIDNEEENDFVQRLVSQCDQGYFYVGLVRIKDQPTDGWQWIDNTTVSYNNWSLGEPSGESCAYMESRSGYWDDYYCSHARKAVCERKNSLK